MTIPGIHSLELVSSGLELDWKTFEMGNDINFSYQLDETSTRLQAVSVAQSGRTVFSVIHTITLNT